MRPVGIEPTEGSYPGHLAFAGSAVLAARWPRSSAPELSIIYLSYTPSYAEPITRARGQLHIFDTRVRAKKDPRASHRRANWDEGLLCDRDGLERPDLPPDSHSEPAQLVREVSDATAPAREHLNLRRRSRIDAVVRATARAVASCGDCPPARLSTPRRATPATTRPSVSGH